MATPALKLTNHVDTSGVEVMLYFDDVAGLKTWWDSTPNGFPEPVKLSDSEELFLITSVYANTHDNIGYALCKRAVYGRSATAHEPGATLVAPFG